MPAPLAADLGYSPDIYRLIIESAPNAMVMTDHEGRIVLVNAQTEKLFGYAREELIGRPVEILLPAQARERHQEHLKSYAAAPQPRSMGAGRDLYGVRKDGAQVPVEIGLNPIRTQSQTLVMAAIVDITERRELQRKLAQSETLAAVGAMATVMAHEIRNPLGSIVMAAKSLIGADLSAADREIVSDVLAKESQRLSRTLHDFLQYARPREPKRELADLNRTVTGIVKALQADREQAGRIEFQVSLDKGLAAFPHDADQVRQVLWNLILNAVQSMQGKGRLRITTAADARHAHFCVADSGPGISAQALEKIFDPFFTTKKTGTGLGLAIAQRIISAHGGRITADNEPGAGARFCVSLPLQPS